jgi:hypothetical protein
MASEPKNNNFKIDFIGIGAERAGTTWIAENLNKHPQICLSEPKEIYYFNKKNFYASSRTFNKNYNKKIEWYKQHFVHCSKNSIKGEFCVAYLYDKHSSQKIKETFPNIKLIVSLRNPIERAYSQYLFYKYMSKREQRPFNEVIRKEKEYIEKGLYCKQLKKYMDFFQKEQLLIVTLDDLKDQPLQTIKKIYQFLKVDASFTPRDLSKKVNQFAQKTNFIFIDKLIYFTVRNMDNLGISRARILRLAKRFGFVKAITKINRSRMDYPQMFKESKDYLSTAFKEDISKLENLLDRDLSSWK